MRIDRQTLQDLDVLGTASGEPGLFDRLDRTRTRGGRRALQRRFTQPLGSVREIRAVQECLRYIATHRSSLAALPDERLLDALDRYLGSRFVTLKRVRGPSASVESLWVRLRDPELYREAERGVEIARALADGERSLVIIDELFRGTNVKDACDASLKVIQAFAGARNGTFLIASHLIELAAELAQSAGVLLMRFEAELTGDDVRLDYCLRSGVSDQRLGMKVLEQEGVLASLEAIRETSEAEDGTPQRA